MIREEGDRAVLHCDAVEGGVRCVVRIDVGRATQYRAGVVKMPTGWFSLGANRHQCSLHQMPRLEVGP